MTTLVANKDGLYGMYSKGDTAELVYSLDCHGQSHITVKLRNGKTLDVLKENWDEVGNNKSTAGLEKK